MGLFAHATHVFIPDREHGKLVAGAILRTAHSVVMTTPYGKWLNVYLPLGLTYKDVPDLPTATAFEFNCYDSEGLDVRLYANDRLAFIFESGLTDAGEEEDRLLEIASGIFEQESKLDEEGESEEKAKSPNFWTLDEEKQNEWVKRARESTEFQKFVSDAVAESSLPDATPIQPFLPEGRSLDDFRLLLAAIHARISGPPRDPAHVEVLTKWMGETHSTKAEDYLEAIGKFLDLRGCLWSLETIQEMMGDQIDRRIVPIDTVDFHPES